MSDYQGQRAGASDAGKSFVLAPSDFLYLDGYAGPFTLLDGNAKPFTDSSGKPTDAPGVSVMSQSNGLRCVWNQGAADVVVVLA